MTGHHIARSDKQDIMTRAHIDMLEREILHKAKVLSAQCVDNPGLKPVLENYLKHIRERREDAVRMLRHLHALMLSINTITITQPYPHAEKIQKRASHHFKSTSYMGGGGEEMNKFSKIQSDQQAIMAEITKWKSILTETSEEAFIGTNGR